MEKNVKRNYEYYFQALLENMLEGVAIHQMIFDENKKPINYIIMDVNKSYENILGLNRNLVKGKLASEIYGNVPALDKYSDVVINKKSIKFDFYYSTMKKYFNISVSPWNDVGFITIFSDITDSKIEIERTKAILRAIPDMMFMFDSDCRFIDYHAENPSHLYVDKNFIIGKLVDEVLPFDVSEKTRENVNKVFETKSPCYFSYELEIDGNLYNYEARLVPCSEKQVLSIVRDITDLKKFEIELLNSKEKAEQSEKLKIAFLSNMSHELRTPINSIIGFSELLKEKEISNVNKNEYLDIIIKNGDILTNLINDIIDVTKIDSGTLKIQKTEIDLNKLFLQLKTEYAKLIKNNKVKLIIDIDLNTNVFLLTDKFRLKQILFNLMTNAMKFTKKGFIKFGYEILDNTNIKIYVEDTGIGISEENMKFLFHRFVQFSHPGEEKNKGAGLGLSISKSLCEILGYELNVKSKLEYGSIFYFNVPYIIKDEKIYMGKIKTDDNFLDLNLKNFNVLVVEDDENFKMILEKYLKNTKCNLFLDDGKNALNIIKNEHKIDIVLLDLGLGDINGYDILEEIKKIDKNIIIIVQSAYAMIEFQKKALELGANYFLPKPVSKSQLLNTINKLI